MEIAAQDEDAGDRKSPQPHICIGWMTLGILVVR